MANKTRYPGKFEGCTNQEKGEELYNISLNGCDEELGDVPGFGWNGLIKYNSETWYIVTEDNQGFFDYEVYSPHIAEITWNRLLKEEEEFTNV